MSALDTLLFGYRTIKTALGVLLPNQSVLQFIGATIADDPTNKATVVTISQPTGGFAGGGLVTGLFGDGSDGTAVCDGTTSVTGMTLAGGAYTINRDVYFLNLTINASKVVNCGGWRVFARTLTVNGRLTSCGGNGTAGAGGIPNTVTLGANTSLSSGGIGGYQAGGQGTANTLSAAGGDSGDGESGGTAGAPGAAYGGFRSLDELTRCVNYECSGGQVSAWSQLQGGPAGAGNSSGTAGGGAGGGVLMVACGMLIGGSAGRIDANGGDAYQGNTDSYGAGGGAGGLVVLLAGNSDAWAGVAQAAGGDGGPGTTTRGFGGGAGLVIQPQ